jgi:hypothetical protein
MTITLFFLLSIGWTLLSLAWFVICNYYTSKGEMPKWLYDFCGHLQRVFFCCFPLTKADDKKKKNQEAIIDNGEFKMSQDQEITEATIVEEVKCVCCQKLFTSCLQKRVKVETINIIDTRSDLPIEGIEPIEKEKPKCNFCNRCKSCQADFDKDKAKGKVKKDIEARCNALNYLVFICVLLLMFISNMALWLSMSH